MYHFTNLNKFTNLNNFLGTNCIRISENLPSLRAAIVVTVLLCSYSNSIGARDLWQ